METRRSQRGTGSGDALRRDECMTAIEWSRCYSRTRLRQFVRNRLKRICVASRSYTLLLLLPTPTVSYGHAR